MRDPAIRIESVCVQYSQETDSCDPTQNSIQTIDVEAIDAGGGHYLVISAERWAIDATGIDAFADKLREVLAMCERGA